LHRNTGQIYPAPFAAMRKCRANIDAITAMMTLSTTPTWSVVSYMVIMDDLIAKSPKIAENGMAH
jgi:hypothetical protein